MPHPGFVTHLLEPTPGRLAFALRLSLICALSTYLVERYQTPEPALTAYLVFFLNKPDRGTSLILHAAMVILITVLIAGILFAADVVIDYPFWRLGSMAALSCGLLFLASASRLRPIAATIALIVAYALDLVGSAPAGEVVVRGLLYAWLMVALPAGVSLMVNAILAPSPLRCARLAIAERLELIAHSLESPGSKMAAERERALCEGNQAIAKWLKLAHLERSGDPVERRRLREAAGSSFALLALTERLAPAITRQNAPLCVELVRLLREAAVAIRRGDCPETLRLPLDAVSLAAVTPEARDALLRLAGILSDFGIAPPVVTPAQPARKGFFLPDAFTNPEHRHYAFKTTAAALFCYVTYTLLDWPGIHTCFITCYIVSLGTTGETVEKLGLRLFGCLAGAALGTAAMLWLIPELTSIEALMALVFVGALLAGWIAAGSERIAYAGYQVAFAFFLCVLQGAAPAFDLTIARDRVIGILFGNLVAYLMFTRVWPVSIGQRIDRLLLGVLRQLAAMPRVRGDRERQGRAAEVWGTLATLEKHLDLSRLEPRSIRPPEAALQPRERLLDIIRLLAGNLLFLSDRNARELIRAGRQLEWMADQFDARVVFPRRVSADPPSASAGPDTSRQRPAQLPSGAWIDGPLADLGHTLDELQPMATGDTRAAA